MSSNQLSAIRVLQGEAAGAAVPISWTQTGLPVAHAGPGPHEAAGGPLAQDSPDATAEIESAVAAALAAQAENFEAQLQARLDHARLSAKAEGLREGERLGREQAAAELEPLMARLLRTIEDLSQTRDSFRREAEEDIVRLALGIARRVVHREATVDPAILTGVIRAALDKIGSRELHRVLVSPDDQPVVAAGLEAARLPRRIEVIADPNLERGAVLFETIKGTLDASLETQLDEIERGLVDALDAPRRPA